MSRQPTIADIMRMADISSSVVTGVFSLAAGLGGVLLKDYLESRRVRRSQPRKRGKVSAARANLGAPARPILRSANLAMIASWLFLAGWFTGNVGAKARPLISELGNIHWEALVALVSLILASFVLASGHLSGALFSRLIGYELKVLSLWAGFTVSWSLTCDGSHDLPLEGFVRLWVEWWVASAVFGAILLVTLDYRRKRRETSRTDAEPSTAPDRLQPCIFISDGGQCPSCSSRT
jgi:hypothetical protein